jgi:hypothetical protein
MKKMRVLAVALFFLGTSITQPAIGAVKAGSSCTKAGIKSVNAGKTYTCVKRGKKLVWNKGVLIPVAKPVPTPSVSASPEPSPSMSPSPVAVPIEEIEFWWAAMLDVRSHRKTPTTLQTMDFKSAPNVSEEESKKFKSLIDEVLVYWSQFIVNPLPLNVTVISEKDYDWYMGRWKELGSDNTGQYWWDKTGNGEGGAVGWNDKGQINMYFKVLTYRPSTLATREHVFHEVTHYFQATALKTEVNLTPCWYGEGQAQFIQSAQSDINDQSAKIVAKRNRGHAKNEVNRYLNYAPTQDRLFDLVANIKRGDELCNRIPPYLGYTLGQLVNEKLAGDFSWASVIEFMKKSPDSGWSNAFRNVFGVDVDNWYSQKLIPYLMQELKQVS